METQRIARVSVEKVKERMMYFTLEELEMIIACLGGFVLLAFMIIAVIGVAKLRN